MKKSTQILLNVLVILFLLFNTTNTYSIDYMINFTGSGASNTVDSVLVQNLTQGKSVTVPQGYQLNLRDVTAIEQIKSDYEVISIIPNPITDRSVVSFYAKKAGITQINVVGIDGKIITGINSYLTEGKNSFQLLLNKGAYILKVSGNGFTYSSMILSRSDFGNKPVLSFIGNEKIIKDKPQKTKDADVVILTYSSGDQLLYKGCSRNYSTLVTDKPTSSKTTDFEFVECKDADGNNYTIVKIGDQTWMAENLKTTKYRNGEEIGTTNPSNKDINSEVKPKYQWSYNGDENNVKKYGRLYTWYSLNDIRNITPVGWHVPTDNEWSILENYLIENKYNYDGSTTGSKVGKALASTTDWITLDTETGDIGNDLKRNNSSGFSAMPGGSRENNGVFNYIGKNGHWWSSTQYSTVYDPDEAWIRRLNFSKEKLYWEGESESDGFSVRCVLDENINIKTVNIPAGTFIMGSPVDEHGRESDETPHEVIISAFRMSKYEITNAQFAAFLNAKGIGASGEDATGAYPNKTLIFPTNTNSWGLTTVNRHWVSINGYENYPVINVTWYGAAEFASYMGGSLPTEAQWEYACRAGTTTPFNTGSCLKNIHANYNWANPYDSCSNTSTDYPGKTQAVGTYQPNAFGLYDMHGNVYEWCNDWYGAYSSSTQLNPKGVANGAERVFRGGSWFSNAHQNRSAFRAQSTPDDVAGNVLGFRIVLGLNIETVYIPAGTFVMGSPTNEVFRNPIEIQHDVTLSAFRMSKYEITNAQYAVFLNAKGIGSNGIYAAGMYPTQTLITESSGSNDWGLHYSNSQWVPVAGYENHPVINVNWYGAAEFAAYVGGALPTEAQWEYACRAGTTTTFHTGSCLTNTQANYNWAFPYNSCTNSVTTYPEKIQVVGTYAPNAFGLYDMHGNVSEWCSDWYGNYPTAPQTNPLGSATGVGRVQRGGSWGSYAQFSRTAFRNSFSPEVSGSGIGFRVVFVP